ncbi:hypothetical protein TNCV_2939041 [Trichonephila clavipes]|nr:hypothetical protein TNCV_2939041 [Trichonephila clavipes]
MEVETDQAIEGPTEIMHINEDSETQGLATYGMACVPHMAHGTTVRGILRYSTNLSLFKWMEVDNFVIDLTDKHLQIMDIYGIRKKSEK